MAPIKFDDHIREQLQEREIQPSDLAWKKLNKELNQSSKKTTKISWYAIAASFIGLIVVASLLFKNQSNSILNTNKIVETDTNKIKNEIQKEPLFKTKNNKLVTTTETQSEEEKISEVTVVSENKNTISINKTQNEKPEISFVNSENKVIDKPNQEPVVVSKNEINTSESDFIDLKVAEIVAEVAAIKKSNKEISEDEINVLLEKAQLEIQSQKIIANKKVDATALLNTVEEELEANFRDKVFDALGEQFEKVRTAVIDRNN